MPNANITMKRGQLANLNAQAIVDGTIYVTTDEGAMYVDVGNSRIRLGDFVPVETLNALQNITPISEKAMYYVKEGNILARYDSTNSRWIQINKAGIVSVSVTGSGNVISNITTQVDQYGQMTLVVTKSMVEGSSGGTADPQIYQDIEDIKADIQIIKGSSSTSGSIAKAVADARAALLGSPTTYMTIEALETALAGVSSTANAADTLSKANKASLDTLSPTVSQATSDISELQSTIGSTDASGLRKKIKDLETALALLNNPDASVSGSVKHAVAEGVASIVANANSSYDTLKEIADWILNDTTGAAAIANQVQQNASDISTLQGQVTPLETKVTQLTADANTAGSVAYQIAAEASARSTEDTRLAGLISNNTTAINQLDSDVNSVKNSLIWKEF